ncbi:MAG TPA: glycoside hydrolase family 3 C-terminal domain-containing protein [Mycobacteriales bacterium]|nr:glycoside hydrolase family 3 C-terminal domain-containing protein [Mycobacteriales bacterium]
MLRARFGRTLLVAAVVAAGAAPAVLAPSGAPVQAASCPWMDRHKSPAQRAHELVAAMTLDQKIAELYGRGDFTHYGAANDIPAVPELCIPELVFNDAGAGIGDAQTNTTAFPDGITQTASWDRDMQRRLGAAIGWEAWHKGVDVQLAPGVDIARNPLNGRNFEYAGEDPYLAGETGAAEIQGIQSQHVVATVKHYALNDQETNRMSDSSDASERTMQEIHLPAYETAVKQGHVGSVMCSYNRINAVYACQDRWLLTHVLKHQFGFTGWVMSDWSATHSTVAAANAGLDQEQTIGSGQYFSAPLKAAVQAGKVSRQRLDDMVFRLMYSLFRIGVFDDPPAPEPQASTAIVDTDAEKAIARTAAEGGAVLLKNSDGALPIHGNGKRIAVIGDPAGPDGAQNAYQGGGSSRVPIDGPNPNVVSPLRGITTRAEADGDVVTYANGSDLADAIATASAADVAVVFAADAATEGQDRPSLALTNGSCTLVGCTYPPGATPDQVIAAVAAANPHTIVVLQTSGPVTMPWLSKVKSVLEMWYPGEQDGNAAAALLFGDVNPSGKLPITFPKKLSDGPLRTKAQYPGVPDNHGVPRSEYSERLLVGYRWYDEKHIRPLFPFGFGLSYTTFRYSGLRVQPTSHGVQVRFRVTNTGQRAGAEVAQLYVSDPPAAHEPPKQLKGYAKVELQAGESQVVTLRLNKRAFSYWSTSKHAWTVAPGCYGVRVGGSSRDLPLHGHVARAGGTCAEATP